MERLTTSIYYERNYANGLKPVAAHSFSLADMAMVKKLVHSNAL